MPLRTALLPSLLFGCSILHVSAIPVDPEPTAFQPRDSDSTTIPNWLDYAPDFSQDPFPPWPPITNPDGSNITTQNVRGTKLFGWKGCDSGAVKIIQESFKDFETLAGQKALYDDDIDWNSQAALDIWGHSTDDRQAVQDDRKLQIKQIYQAAQQINNKYWYAPPYFWTPPWVAWKDLWIRVQCSPKGDDGKKCGDQAKPPPQCPGNDQPPDDGKTSEVEAYSDPLGTYSKITFCNRFFNKINSLSFVASTARRNSKNYQNDLWNYQNRARVVFHEITHLNYFMNAPDKSPFVDDVRIRYGSGKQMKNTASYGPEDIKILANYEAVGKGGFYTQRNADSYAWFAVAKYIESQIGSYPTNPVTHRIPNRAPRRGDGAVFATSSDTEEGNNADVDGTSVDGASATDEGNSAGSVDGSTDPTANATSLDNHWTPGCPDHPILQSDTFGVSSVNSDANATCDTNALSGIPYNVFHGESGNVYDKFCFNIDSTANLQWTVDAHGEQKLPSKKKRTPPPNPNAYGSYNFELNWEMTANEGCGQNPESCSDAFAKIANSQCWHQGGEQNGMTATAKIDIPGCGTYSYNITGPDVPASSSSSTPPASPSPPPPTVGSQWCYDSAAFGDHGDISESFQASSATDACNGADGHMITNDNSTSIHYTPSNYMGDVPYVYDIYWEPNCQSSVTQMDARKPLSGEQAVTCASLLTSDYKNCNNGGIGGKISVGCLTYRFKASDTQE